MRRRGEAVTIEHAAKRTLVVLHSRYMSYRNTAEGSGDLFVDNMCGGPWHFEHPQKAWLRDLNIEGRETKVFNKAADLWILGYKSEGWGTLVHNTGSQARTELLGGLQYPVSGKRPFPPLAINDGGQMSAVLSLFWANEILAQETQGGDTRELERKPGTRFMHYGALSQ